MRSYRAAGQSRLFPENELKGGLPLIHPEFCKRLDRKTKKREVNKRVFQHPPEPFAQPVARPCRIPTYATSSLTCILHEGGRLMYRMLFYIKALHEFSLFDPRLQFVLFGFRPDLASHPGRPVSNHSYSYVSSPGQPACLARPNLNSLSACNAQAGESFMQYAS